MAKGRGVDEIRTQSTLDQAINDSGTGAEIESQSDSDEQTSAAELMMERFLIAFERKMKYFGPAGYFVFLATCCVLYVLLRLAYGAAYLACCVFIIFVPMLIGFALLHFLSSVHVLNLQAICSSIGRGGGMACWFIGLGVVGLVFWLIDELTA